MYKDKCLRKHTTVQEFEMYYQILIGQDCAMIFAPCLACCLSFQVKSW